MGLREDLEDPDDFPLKHRFAPDRVVCSERLNHADYCGARACSTLSRQRLCCAVNTLIAGVALLSHHLVYTVACFGFSDDLWLDASIHDLFQTSAKTE